MDKQIQRQMKDKGTQGQTVTKMDTDKLKYRQTGTKMDKWTQGPTDKWKDSQDRRTNGNTNRWT